MKHFFKLIRYQNLILLAFMQLIFRYGFLKLQKTPIALALSDLQYLLLVLATISIAAGGYVINNIFDKDTDEENKPNDVVVGKFISESTAYNIYIALNILGVGLGFYLSNVILKPSFASVFILIAGTLYLYASSLKQNLFIGNIIVALLLAVSVLIIGIFDLLPATYEENKPTMGMLFGILIDYAVFAFIINFIREIIKDLEDVKGDYNQGMSTLPIVFGVDKTTKIVLVISILPLVLIVKYIYQYIFLNNLIVSCIYGLITIVSPLIYFSVKLFSAKNKNDFKHLSTVLKAVVFFGILSILIITLNIKYNA